MVLLKMGDNTVQEKPTVLVTGTYSLGLQDLVVFEVQFVACFVHRYLLNWHGQLTGWKDVGNLVSCIMVRIYKFNGQSGFLYQTIRLSSKQFSIHCLLNLAQFVLKNVFAVNSHVNTSRSLKFIFQR